MVSCDKFNKASNESDSGGANEDDILNLVNKHNGEFDWILNCGFILHA